MAVLDDVKILLTADASKEPILTLYIRKACTLINNYLNITVDAEISYPDAVIEYVVLCYRKKGNEGLKHFGQGSRSGTYEDSLPVSVKALLPLPSIKMMG
jgi:hypothetical protein